MSVVIIVAVDSSGAATNVVIGYGVVAKLPQLQD